MTCGDWMDPSYRQAITGSGVLGFDLEGCGGGWARSDISMHDWERTSTTHGMHRNRSWETTLRDQGVWVKELRYSQDLRTMSYPRRAGQGGIEIFHRNVMIGLSLHIFVDTVDSHRYVSSSWEGEHAALVAHLEKSENARRCCFSGFCLLHREQPDW